MCVCVCVCVCAVIIIDNSVICLLLRLGLVGFFKCV